MQRSDRYGTKQVRRIIENYQALKETQDTTAGGLHALVQVADIDRALTHAITWDQWEVILLHGLIGVPMESVAKLLDVPRMTAWDRYETAMTHIQWFLNGDMAAGWTQHVQRVFEEDE